jgi:hypothetical protein
MDQYSVKCEKSRRTVSNRPNTGAADSVRASAPTLPRDRQLTYVQLGGFMLLRLSTTILSALSATDLKVSNPVVLRSTSPAP